MRLVIITALLFVCGCGTGTRSGTSFAPSTVMYQGRTADAWGKELLDQDPGISQKGADALRSLGPAGVPYLLKGVESDTAMIRSTSLLALHDGGDAIRSHSDAAVPILMKKLDDPQHTGAVAQLLAIIGPPAKPAIPKLQEALKLHKDRTGEVIDDAIRKISATK
jgi:hypothetical protein